MNKKIKTIFSLIRIPIFGLTICIIWFITFLRDLISPMFSGIIWTIIWMIVASVVSLILLISIIRITEKEREKEEEKREKEEEDRRKKEGEREKEVKKERKELHHRMVSIENRFYSLRGYINRVSDYDETYFEAKEKVDDIEFPLPLFFQGDSSYWDIYTLIDLKKECFEAEEKLKDLGKLVAKLKRKQ